MDATYEFLKAALLVGAMFVAVALALEIPVLGDAAARAAFGGFEWVAENRWLAITAVALGLSVFLTAVRLNAKGGPRREAHDACGGS